MTVPYERITLTAYSNQDVSMVKLLAKLQGNTVSSVAARALNEWLRENFSKEIESFNQVQNLIQEESNAETIWYICDQYTQRWHK